MFTLFTGYVYLMIYHPVRVDVSYSSKLRYNRSAFVVTKQMYNGSLTYNGLFNACKKEYLRGVPCTSQNMVKGFWKFNLPTSWVLDLQVNCLGYTTNSTYTLGTCIDERVNYVTQCSCNQIQNVCCFLV